MNYRTPGKTGLCVPELGMGCSGIGRTMYRRDDSDARATLLESPEAGVNFFDTVPGYSISNWIFWKAESGRWHKRHCRLSSHWNS